LASAGIHIPLLIQQGDVDVAYQLGPDQIAAVKGVKDVRVGIAPLTADSPGCHNRPASVLPAITPDWPAPVAAGRIRSLL
jgi:hypothetical protein